MSPADPTMEPGSVLTGEHWRIAFLTDSLVRLEWSPNGVFEDRPTQVVVNRRFPPVEVRASRRAGRLVAETDHVRLTYDGGPFTPHGLSAVVTGAGSSTSNTWHPGDEPVGNLGGTARTLDNADGTVELGTGVASRDGWAVLDDSASAVVIGDGTTTALTQPRADGARDLYLFAYGHRYAEAVRDLHRLTGPAPLLPRWSLGTWWSRYHRYTADEYLALMDRFAAEGIPLTTAVLDMDWHLTDIDPAHGSGWTGYTWNRELFPDPPAFLSALHERGLRTALNVHPRDGVRSFEEAYPAVAAAVGVDAAHGEPVELDLTDPTTVSAYLDMHHALEDQGVDLWWIDWQQGAVTRQPGLDPLWTLNHLHHTDAAARGAGVILSRYAGPGSHRYPIGFSGDTVVSWASLAFQPLFTQTASNIGYGWWSHDIGGHMLGTRDEELEARWFQLGTFSPVNRLHSSASPFSGKEPWNFHEPARSAMVEALRLRHRLVPYLHTMNWRSAAEGAPLVVPVYWNHPEEDVAYDLPGEYYFGSELLVAPVVEPADPEVARGRSRMWFPPGEWFDLTDGRRYAAGAGGMRMEVWRPLDRVPAFARAGAVVPLQELPASGAAPRRAGEEDAPSALEVLVFPGADGELTMVEGPAPGRARTRVWLEWRRGRIGIDPVRGDQGVVPAVRTWTVTLRGVAPTRAHLEATEEPVRSEYDADTLTLTLHVGEVAADAGTTLTLDQPALAVQPWREDVRSVLMDARIPYLTKGDADDLVRRHGVRALPELRTLERSEETGGIWASHLPAGVLSAIEEVLLRTPDVVPGA